MGKRGSGSPAVPAWSAQSARATLSLSGIQHGCSSTRESFKCFDPPFCSSPAWKGTLAFSWALWSYFSISGVSLWESPCCIPDSAHCQQTLLRVRSYGTAQTCFICLPWRNSASNKRGSGSCPGTILSVSTKVKIQKDTFSPQTTRQLPTYWLTQICISPEWPLNHGQFSLLSQHYTQKAIKTWALTTNLPKPLMPIPQSRNMTRKSHSQHRL